MKASRILAVGLAFFAAAAAGVQGSDDNLLQRDRGIVTYAPPGSTPRSLEGSVGVGNAVIAATGGSALATLKLVDSSEIRIGALSTVRISDLRAAAGANLAGGSISIERGAVRFEIVHPAGARASYRFVTPTSQLAVRGTVGYFVHGPGGDQIYCVSCDDGDVAIDVGGGRAAPVHYTIHSGETLNVRAPGSLARLSGAIDETKIVPNKTINNPAIDQFLNGLSPFGEPASTGFDPTLSRSAP